MIVIIWLGTLITHNLSAAAAQDNKSEDEDFEEEQSVSSMDLDPSDFAEDTTEVYDLKDLEDLEEVGEEMPSSKTKSPKKSPKNPAAPKKKGQKLSSAPSIQDIISGMDWMKITSKSKRYSFTIYEPYKNHPFVMGDKNLVLVEVFTSPVPQN